MNSAHFHELLAGELLNDLTAAERAELDQLLLTDPAAVAARKEFYAMNDLLEKTSRDAQPDPAFEQRMVAGVRRKLKARDESPWESVLFLGRTVRGFFAGRRWWEYSAAGVGVLAVMVLFVVTQTQKGVFASINGQLRDAQSSGDENLVMDREVAKSPAFFSRNTMVADSDDQEKKRADAPVMESAAPSAPTDMTTVTATAALAAPTSAAMSYTGGSSPGMANWGRNAVSQAVASSDAAQKDKALDLQQPLAYSAMVATAAAPADNRKLVRNAEADLEVKSYQDAVDQIGAITREAGGYVDASQSQRGGNGKLQGTVVIKVLPGNFDGVLLKLRNLGKLQNQTIATEDVTKAYTDTQARLDNSRRMEAQLQDLLKRDNGKVAELLEVERELGRVRGEIEQMQGELKMYDFQVEYATVTLHLTEKNLNQAAAYLLKEQDDFSLFVVDVEQAYQQAKVKADAAGAQVLSATLSRDAGSDAASADLTVVVAPEKVDAFLDDVRGLGRTENFHRQSQRVANDGGNATAPADSTRTERDQVQVHLSIQSDNVSRQQVALTVVTSGVDAALEKARTAASAQAGADILNSSLNTSTEGQATAQLTVRVPGPGYGALLSAFRALGRSAAFSVQHNDPGASGESDPVVLSLTLTDQETPIQTTELDLRTAQVEAQVAAIKIDAAAAGAEVKAANFEQRPDGLETAHLTLRVAQAGYAKFLASIQQRGETQSLSVQRQDRPGETQSDAEAPIEIELTLHNQSDLVAPDHGFWAMLRSTFGEGASALYASLSVIGIMLAFVAPWLAVLAFATWVGRRIYLARR